MLNTLTVWNFALIAQAEINFGAGLNILTGETGAGKSIFIDALGAVLGHRLSTDCIRTGCDWLRVEAIFDLDGGGELKDFLAESAIDCEDDELIITRQLTAKGKNSILVNGCRTTLAVLKTIGEHLFDIHGQNENLALLKPENRFRLVDESDGGATAALAAYRAAYKNKQAIAAELAEKEETLAAAAERGDLLRWQEQEISEAKLQPGEDEKLETELSRLSNMEKITEAVGECCRRLQGGSGGDGIVGDISVVQSCLEQLDRYDDELSDLIPRLDSARAELSDVLERISDYSDGLEFDPVRLDFIQSRLDKIDKLKKKYGHSLEAVLEKYQNIQAELAMLESGDSDIAELRRASAAAEAELRQAADELTKKRRRAGDTLTAAITEELKALGMAAAVFSCQLTPVEPGENGADDLTLLFSANDGEAPRPLEKIASGGELSRISLAIKSAAAAGDTIAPSMVFDEIDTGIGGRTAQMLAERIARVARRRQVLCVTHLAAIACMADVHLYLAKDSADGETTTTVRRLADDEEITEIARMASGLELSPAALDNAREMLDHARKIKAKLAR